MISYTINADYIMGLITISIGLIYLIISIPSIFRWFKNRYFIKCHFCGLRGSIKNMLLKNTGDGLFCIHRKCNKPLEYGRGDGFHTCKKCQWGAKE